MTDDLREELRVTKVMLMATISMLKAAGMRPEWIKQVLETVEKEARNA